MKDRKQGCSFLLLIVRFLFDTDYVKHVRSYRARGQPFNDGTHNGLSVQ